MRKTPNQMQHTVTKQPEPVRPEPPKIKSDVQGEIIVLEEPQPKSQELSTTVVTEAQSVYEEGGTRARQIYVAELTISWVAEPQGCCGGRRICSSMGGQAMASLSRVVTSS